MLERPSAPGAEGQFLKTSNLCGLDTTYRLTFALHFADVNFPLFGLRTGVADVGVFVSADSDVVLAHPALDGGVVPAGVVILQAGEWVAVTGGPFEGRVNGVGVEPAAERIVFGVVKQRP